MSKVTLEEEIKTTTFTSPQVKAGLNVMFTGYWLNDQWNAVFKKFGISQQQYNVLRILRGQKGNPINLMDIQDRMLQKNSNTTRIVEKLRTKELATRLQCRENRRKVEIAITPSGLKLLEDIDVVMAEQERVVFNTLTRKDAEDLNYLLNKLRN